MNLLMLPEVADPQNQFGNVGSFGVDLNFFKLACIDAIAFILKIQIGLPKVTLRGQDFTFYIF